MKAVKESKRLVALLAVLFLMSGVFPLIAAASPEDTDTKDPAEKTYTENQLQISEAVRIQKPKIKKVLFEKYRTETIRARVETLDPAVQTAAADNAAVPNETTEQTVNTEPEVTAVPAEAAETAAAVPAEEVYVEPAADQAVVPEQEPEFVPEETYAEPEYIPEETYAEPEYIPEETYTEPEYIPEVQPEYIPEEPQAAPETYVQPEYVPETYIEPAPETVAEPAPEAVPEPVPETTPEPVPEAAAEPAAEQNLTYLGNFMLTAYCPCSSCCGAYATGYTASGTLATEGVTVAMGGVDFGTKVSINGHIYTVEDRGTAYGHVDIFFNDHGSALAFGLQYADVYLVG